MHTVKLMSSLDRAALGMHTTEAKYETDPTTGWVSPVGEAPLYMEKILFVLTTTPASIALTAIRPSAYGGQLIASAETICDLEKVREQMRTVIFAYFVVQSPVIRSVADLKKDLVNVNVVIGECTTPNICFIASLPNSSHGSNYALRDRSKGL